MNAFDPRKQLKSLICETVARDERREVHLKYFTKSVLSPLCQHDSNDISSLRGYNSKQIFEMLLKVYTGPNWSNINDQPDAWDHIINNVFRNFFHEFPFQASVYIKNCLLSRECICYQS